MFTKAPLLTTTALLLAIAGCARDETPVAAEWSEETERLAATFAATRLASSEEVDRVVAHAAASKRAVLFLHVNWAMLGREHRQFADFALAYPQQRPSNPLGFHFVDCSQQTRGYRALRSLPGWRELESARGTSLIHGMGEVVWIDQGQVVQVEPIDWYQSTDELIAKTDALLPLPP